MVRRATQEVKVVVNDREASGWGELVNAARTVASAFGEEGGE